jgi:hypothetical protein
MSNLGSMRRYWIGKRVQMHPATDAWWSGDRYGEVVSIGRAREYVTGDTRGWHRPLNIKLDKSGRIVRSHPDDVSEVQS